MKTLKKSFLALCIIFSFLAATTYGQTCTCERSTPGTKNIITVSDYISAGTTVTWIISISTWNQASGNYASAEGYLGSPFNQDYYDYNDDLYTLYEKTFSGDVYVSSGGTVTMICDAQAGSSTGNGYAKSIVTLTW